jgi:hypothetical protein
LREGKGKRRRFLQIYLEGERCGGLYDLLTKNILYIRRGGVHLDDYVGGGVLICEEVVWCQE